MVYAGNQVPGPAGKSPSRQGASPHDNVCGFTVCLLRWLAGGQGDCRNKAKERERQVTSALAGPGRKALRQHARPRPSPRPNHRAMTLPRRCPGTSPGTCSGIDRAILPVQEQRQQQLSLSSAESILDKKSGPATALPDPQIRGRCAQCIRGCKAPRNTTLRPIAAKPGASRTLPESCSIATRPAIPARTGSAASSRLPATSCSGPG